jgi:uncharacterized protein (DUF362 family)
LVLTSRVAIVELEENSQKSLKRALELIGGIEDLNTAKNNVVVKVGVFSHKVGNHTSVDMVKAITDVFSKASKIFLTESDNYQGTALERLQIWKDLFTERIVPFSLSDDADNKKATLAGQEMGLSHILFKPNILVSTHILRSFERGSILKNLFGCISTPKKAKFHKILAPLLADVYEAIGGIDLAVLDGTHYWYGAGALPIPMNTVLAGRDAVAVETVGATLAGLKTEKMPIIQEFVKRGLGEGDLKNIEIVGATLESLREKFKLATQQHKQKWRERGGAPKRWAPAIDNLIREGFFKMPNKRTREDVKKALKAKSISVEGNMNLVVTTLTRRVKKGVLKAVNGSDGWIYWTE